MYLSTEPDLDEAVAFALGYARKHWNAPGLDLGAVESAAMQGAWDAYKRFDPSRKTKWCTYLHNMVEWYIHKGQRGKYNKMRAAGNFVSFNDVLEREMDVEKKYDSVLPRLDPTDQREETLNHLALREALDTLEPHEREVVVMLHCECYTKREALGRLGPDWRMDRIQQVERAGLEKLRLALA